jgi:hypothetical protein
MLPNSSPRLPWQEAQKIVDNPYFQEEMIRLRKKWNIPEQGFTDIDKHQEWAKAFDRQEYEYIWSDEQAKARRLLKEKRQKLSPQEYTIAEEKKDWEELNAKIPVNEFHMDLNILRRELGLENYWDNFMQGYLISNKAGRLQGYNSYIESRIKADSTDSELYLRIFANTTLDDIKEMWHLVELHQSKLPGYKKLHRDSDPQIIERDKYIMELIVQGKKPRHIKHMVYNKFVGENDEKYNEIYDLSDVNARQLVSKLRKKVTPKKLH